MKLSDKTAYFVFLFCFCCVFPSLSFGQRQLKGRIVDATTQQGIASSTLYVASLATGTSADSSGNFSITLPKDENFIVEFRAVGYSSQQIVISPNQDILEVFLESEEQQIETVEVLRKSKYTNRNNPAVELIDRIIQHKPQNRLSGKETIQFDQYEKIKVGMIEPDKALKNKLGDMSFFFQNVDTLNAMGNAQLTLFMEETSGRVYSQKEPSRYKKIISAHKKTEFDQRYINNPNIQVFLNYLFRPVDIYDESLFLVNKLFLSPIANNGKLYYKYYITDTVVHDGLSYVQLAFEPRNSTDLLFRGLLEVSLDGRYAVRLAKLRLGANTNINFVNNIDVDLQYTPDTGGLMLQDRAHFVVVFGSSRSDAFFGERLILNEDYDLTSPISSHVFSGEPVEDLSGKERSAELLNRPIPLSSFEEQTYRNVDSLNELKSFKRLAALGYLLAQGYYNFGAFELGPLEYLYSQNNIEGQRLRIGGRSTQLLSEKMYLEGYLAYGFRDKELKYNMSAAYSLNERSIVNFPAHYIKADIQHDIFEPGKSLGFKKGDSFFQSFRKNRPTKWMAVDAYRLRHMLEFGNHLSVETGFTHQRRTAIGDMRFVDSGDSSFLWSSIHTNEINMKLRWAPSEKFYYRNLERRTLVENKPVFTLQYSKGLDGFFDGRFRYDALRLSVSNRFFLNQFGFADMSVVSGKILGTLPYPLLEIPTYDDEDDRHVVSYDLVNSMEFVADEFVKFSFQHQLQGFVLNKIPVIKKLKLREIWGGKIFYGKLATANNPFTSTEVIDFEKNDEGEQMTYSLGKHPYMEGYVGIDNIFKVMRVQYIRRLNYLNNPRVEKDKYRLTLRFNF